MISVSVVIPFKGDAEPLGRCVEALVEASARIASVEILVVVDSPRDDAVAAVRNLFREPEVRVLKGDGRGSYAARDIGVRAAAGAVIAFIDADCVPEPTWLAELREVMRDPGVAAVQGQSRGDRRTSIATLVDNAYQFEFAKLVRPDGTCERLDTRNCAVRREVLHAVGSFDDGLRYWGDAELGRRLVRAGHRIVYAPRMRVVHHDVARLAPLLGKAYRIGRVTEVTVRSMPDAWVWQSFPHLLRSEWWLRVRKVRQGAGALPWLLRAVASTAVHLVMLAWRLALKHPQAHRSLSLALAQIHGLGYLRVALEQRRTSAPRPLGGRLS